DLSPDMYDEYNIEVVPANVIIEGKEYLDGVTITPKEMYDAMRAGKKISTSQANQQAFKSPFLKSTEINQPIINYTQSSASKEMYDAIRASKKISTSQANPQDFKSSFLKSDEINQPIIYFTLSAALSGMYQSAKIMEQEVKDTYPQAPIYIIDTKCASLGYGLVIIRAAELAASGASVKEIID